MLKVQNLEVSVGEVQILKGVDMDMMIAGTLDSIVMVEGEMQEVSEAEMLSAIKEAHVVIKAQCQMLLDVAAKVDKANLTSHSIQDLSLIHI